MVAAIVAIMAGLALPRFAEAANRRRLEAAARRVVIDLRFAQRLARASSRQHRVRFIVTTNLYTVETTSDGSTWTAVADINHPSAGYHVDLAKEPYAAKVANASGADVLFVFDGYGQPTADVFIRIGVAGHYQTITVNQATGEISSADSTVTIITVPDGGPKAEPPSTPAPL